ncbi:alpha/beta family hydrolase [Neorhizobium sp. BT27B]|uniref:alpha/beta family hydrolase n=1 Tax=Neorhizobium sp. BT27B TaxID=3142625 RepID=UPI003D2D567F
MNHKKLVTGPEHAAATILLAHGAGGAMDSRWMEDMSAALMQNGFQVVRFEFEYMAAHRTTGKRSPPPRAERLQDEFMTVVEEFGSRANLLIGGKSIGGRVASMIADDLLDKGAIAGLVCLGYPFHPIGKPETLRTAHLTDLRTPTLICQGTRDAFGSKEEVQSYDLSGSIELNWLEDGDHDFKPRKAKTGLTVADNIGTAARRASTWARGLDQAKA